MANRIDSVQNTITPKPAKDTSGTRAGGSVRARDDATAETSASGVRNSVTLTEQGQRLAELEKTLASLPAIDSERVAAVKADIASGNYKVDVENIADVLIATEAEFNE
ncbi:MAG: flagellar biosynthesis anti-sigma factor FlgM [Woeseiaceae bacterium]|nr:flagellar biosynthesis anti-sigma factor FlgM [Woeseiaceae bacterium]